MHYVQSAVEEQVSMISVCAVMVKTTTGILYLFNLRNREKLEKLHKRKGLLEVTISRLKRKD